MEKQKKIRIAGVVAAVLFIAVAAAGSLSRSDSVRMLYQEPRVAVIRVNGPIVGGDDADMAWGSPSSTTSGALMRQFRKARQDDSVQAVLLRVNSPGGSAAATQEAAAELQKLKDLGKPVVVSMGDTAASGAYWLAAYGDKIYANPSTITGSIGVYMSYYDVQGLSEKLGVREEKIKSGPHKDIFSPFRPMTEEERRLTQNMVDDMYEQFVAVVAEQRHMDGENGPLPGRRPGVYRRAGKGGGPRRRAGELLRRLGLCGDADSRRSGQGGDGDVRRRLLLGSAAVRPDQRRLLWPKGCMKPGRGSPSPS